MAEKRSVVRVFIASPGDLGAERTIAKSICDEVNTNMANAFGLHVELVGWEETVTSFGRPQALINQDLDQCDIFFGLLWKRWGSPPAEESRFESGFEEEYERAIARKESGDEIDIGMFLKDVDEDSLRDPGDQLKKVIRFRDKLISEYKVYFEVFSDTDDFADKFRRAIYFRVRNWIKSERNEVRTQPEGASVSAQAPASGALEEMGRVPPEIRSFIEAISNAENSEKGDLEPEEIARLRLVSASFSSYANDPETVGIHDANLIFRSLNPTDVSRREITTFIAAGLSKFDDEVIPFWQWLHSTSSKEYDPIVLYGYNSTPETVREGAMKLASLIGIDWKDESLFARTDAIKNWLSADSHSFRKEVLNYLSRHGQYSDLPSIRKEIDLANTATLSSAIDAYILVQARQSNLDGLQAAAELDPASPSPDVLDMVCNAPADISSSAFEPLLSAKSSEIRKAALDWLLSNSKLADEELERLLDDPSAKIRYLALTALTDNGQDFDFDRAKSILVKPASRPRGLFAGTGRDEEGEKALFKYKVRRSKGIDLETARAFVSAGGLSDRADSIVAYSVRFDDFASEVRSQISDLFDAGFDAEMENLRKQFGEAAEPVIERWRPLKSTTSRDRTATLIAILARNANTPNDISLVRAALDKLEIRFDPEIVQYLARFGNESDYNRIIELFSRPSDLGILAFTENDSAHRKRISADALAKISGRELSDLLAIRAPEILVPSLIKRATNRSFDAASDDVILDLLHDQDPGIRRVASLKFARVASKTRVKNILSKLYDHRGGTYFYNSVFWADFGATFPVAQTRSVIDQLLVEVP